jgi:hypothetical protein
MILARYGISIDLPDGWEGTIYRRPGGGRPILHAANFALAPEDGDFGSRSIASMARGGVFAALLEYDPELAGTGLFGHQGLPLPLRGSEASPASLQRMQARRTGIQRFFTSSSRAFCLFVAMADGPSLPGSIDAANRVLSTVTISARTGDDAEDG